MRMNRWLLKSTLLIVAFVIFLRPCEAHFSSNGISRSESCPNDGASTHSELSEQNSESASEDYENAARDWARVMYYLKRNENVAATLYSHLWAIKYPSAREAADDNVILKPSPASDISQFTTDRTSTAARAWARIRFHLERNERAAAATSCQLLIKDNPRSPQAAYARIILGRYK